jgi:hypothetical protein
MMICFVEQHLHGRYLFLLRQVLRHTLQLLPPVSAPLIEAAPAQEFHLRLAAGRNFRRIHAATACRAATVAAARRLRGR